MDIPKHFKPTLQAATIDDYETIQNMARFYAYDMSRECGFISAEWNFPENGMYESHDFKKYFIDQTRKAYFVKIENELAGFVLLNQIGEYADIEWNMGEFFIVAKYQNKGIGKKSLNSFGKNIQETAKFPLFLKIKNH